MSMQLLTPPVSDERRPGLSVEVIDNLAGFAALAQEWEELLTETDIRNLALSHYWLMTWLEHFPPERLLVILVRNAEGRLLAGAPLMINPGRAGLCHRLLRRLQFIGSQPIVYDWVKIPIVPDADEKAVLKAIAGALRSNPHWDVLDFLFGLEQPRWALMAEVLAPDLVSSGLTPASIVPMTDLPSDFETFQKGMKPSVLKDRQRCMRNLERDFPGELKMEISKTFDLETEMGLERMYDRHIAYWAERGIRSNFIRFPKLRDFYKALLKQQHSGVSNDRPHLVYSALKIGEAVISSGLAIWQGDGLMTYVDAFDQSYRKYAPGSIHLLLMVEEAIRRGGRQLELGRGDEPYKRNWTGNQPPKPLWQLQGFRSHKARLLWQVDLRLKKLVGKA